MKAKTSVKIILAVTMLIVTVNHVSAQKKEVEKRLTEYGLSSDNVFNSFGNDNSGYACTATFTEENSEGTTEYVASYDPLKPKGSQWILKTVNGHTPAKRDLRKFNKAHNVVEDEMDAQIDENSFKIVKDDDHFLVIGMKYNEATLPHKYKFLGQCEAEMYIDKEARRLYKIRFYNQGDMKVKGFTVVKLDMIVEFMSDTTSVTYLVKDETIIMDAKILGQVVEINNRNNYYDYKKVR